MQVGPGSVYDGPTSPDGYYSCGLGNLCQCALCITPQPVRYQPVPTAEVQQNQPQARRPTLHSRRPTLSNHANRQSTYKRFSTAKARQIAGHLAASRPVCQKTGKCESPYTVKPLIERHPVFSKVTVNDFCLCN